MGDYEVVLNWPRPLPDRDLPHAGWTWGSGAGVFAESPDKVWVAQRSEIQLPPGATPWICPCLLTPRRTNTGRRAYSGKDYPYEQRRHHLVFAVDRNGNTIEEWLQHDRLLAPPRGSGLGEAGRGPHKVLISPYDPREAHLDRRRRPAHHQHLHQRREAGADDGRARRARPRPEQLQPPDRHRLAARRHLLRRRRLRRHARGQVRSQRQVPAWTGASRPWIPTKPGPNEFWSVHSIGISRDRRVFVADREHHRMQVFDENGKFLEMWPTGHDSAVLTHIVTEDDFIWVADWTTDRLVKYDLNGRYILDIGGHGAAARAVRRRAPDQRRLRTATST